MEGIEEEIEFACNVCFQGIVGYRFKCLRCCAYDFCAMYAVEVENPAINAYDPSHTFNKLKVHSNSFLDDTITANNPTDSCRVNLKIAIEDLVAVVNAMKLMDLNFAGISAHAKLREEREKLIVEFIFDREIVGEGETELNFLILQPDQHYPCITYQPTAPFYGDTGTSQHKPTLDSQLEQLEYVAKCEIELPKTKPSRVGKMCDCVRRLNVMYDCFALTFQNCERVLATCINGTRQSIPEISSNASCVQIRHLKQLLILFPGNKKSNVKLRSEANKVIRVIITLSKLKQDPWRARKTLRQRLYHVSHKIKRLIAVSFIPNEALQVVVHRIANTAQCATGTIASISTHRSGISRKVGATSTASVGATVSGASTQTTSKPLRNLFQLPETAVVMNLGCHSIDLQKSKSPVCENSNGKHSILNSEYIEMAYDTGNYSTYHFGPSIQCRDFSTIKQAEVLSKSVQSDKVSDQLNLPQSFCDFTECPILSIETCTTNISKPTSLVCPFFQENFYHECLATSTEFILSTLPFDFGTIVDRYLPNISKELKTRHLQPSITDSTLASTNDSDIYDCFNECNRTDIGSKTWVAPVAELSFSKHPQILTENRCVIVGTVDSKLVDSAKTFSLQEMLLLPWAQNTLSLQPEVPKRLQYTENNCVAAGTVDRQVSDLEERFLLREQFPMPVAIQSNSLQPDISRSRQTSENTCNATDKDKREEVDLDSAESFKLSVLFPLPTVEQAFSRICQTKENSCVMEYTYDPATADLKNTAVMKKLHCDSIEKEGSNTQSVQSLADIYILNSIESNFLSERVDYEGCLYHPTAISQSALLFVNDFVTSSDHYLPNINISQLLRSNYLELSTTVEESFNSVSSLPNKGVPEHATPFCQRDFSSTGKAFPLQPKTYNLWKKTEEIEGNGNFTDTVNCELVSTASKMVAMHHGCESIELGDNQLHTLQSLAYQNTESILCSGYVYCECMSDPTAFLLSALPYDFGILMGRHVTNINEALQSRNLESSTLVKVPTLSSTTTLDFDTRYRGRSSDRTDILSRLCTSPIDKQHTEKSNIWQVTEDSCYIVDSVDRELVSTAASEDRGCNCVYLQGKSLQIKQFQVEGNIEAILHFECDDDEYWYDSSALSLPALPFDFGNLFDTVLFTVSHVMESTHVVLPTELINSMLSSSSESDFDKFNEKSNYCVADTMFMTCIPPIIDKNISMQPDILILWNTTKKSWFSTDQLLATNNEYSMVQVAANFYHVVFAKPINCSVTSHRLTLSNNSNLSISVHGVLKLANLHLVIKIFAFETSYVLETISIIHSYDYYSEILPSYSTISKLIPMQRIAQRLTLPIIPRLVLQLSDCAHFSAAICQVDGDQTSDSHLNSIMRNLIVGRHKSKKLLFTLWLTETADSSELTGTLTGKTLKSSSHQTEGNILDVNTASVQYWTTPIFISESKAHQVLDRKRPALFERTRIRNKKMRPLIASNLKESYTSSVALYHGSIKKHAGTTDLGLALTSKKVRASVDIKKVHLSAIPLYYDFHSFIDISECYFDFKRPKIQQCRLREVEVIAPLDLMPISTKSRQLLELSKAVTMFGTQGLKLTEFSSSVFTVTIGASEPATESAILPISLSLPLEDDVRLSITNSFIRHAFEINRMEVELSLTTHSYIGDNHWFDQPRSILKRKFEMAGNRKIGEPKKRVVFHPSTKSAAENKTRKQRVMQPHAPRSPRRRAKVQSYLDFVNATWRSLHSGALIGLNDFVTNGETTDRIWETSYLSVGYERPKRAKFSLDRNKLHDELREEKTMSAEPVTICDLQIGVRTAKCGSADRGSNFLRLQDCDAGTQEFESMDISEYDYSENDDDSSINNSDDWMFRELVQPHKSQYFSDSIGSTILDGNAGSHNRKRTILGVKNETSLVTRHADIGLEVSTEIPGDDIKCDNNGFDFFTEYESTASTCNKQLSPVSAWVINSIVDTLEFDVKNSVTFARNDGEVDDINGDDDLISSLFFEEHASL